MESTLKDIGTYIFWVGVLFMVLVQLCPKKYTLTKGAQATSVSNMVGAFMLPIHMLNRRAKTLKVVSLAMVFGGFILILLGADK